MPKFPDTRYDPQAVEKKIYKLWEKSGYFTPERLPPTRTEGRRLYGEPRGKNQRKSALSPRKSAFCIIMPPPNANGPLHLGHAFEVAIQDLLTRFWRLRGRRTLWLPGADHAGFETQVVFDKNLEKEGRNRFLLNREALYKEIWHFTQNNKKVMEEQLRQLGASCDWSREKFTLDPDIIKIVHETFEKLYRDGLAYRDLRVINWCPKHRTALSDLEVHFVERTDPLYYIKYGPLTLATVRPETKFGDTALAVHPKDRRYQKYVGKEIEAEGISGKLKFQVIADRAVDPEFGTGVVKVTPAHDPSDFEIWARHKNEIPGPKIIIDESGRLTGDVGEFAGLKVSEAREKVAEAMRKIGILEKVNQNYVHQVAACYKCGSTLEPLPKPQWFIRMTAKPHIRRENRKGRREKASLRDLGIEAVKSGKIKFYPKRMEKVYFHWLKNIRDWNISRQIVWGIRIPAWYCFGCGEPKINLKIKSHWFIVRHGETDFNKERMSMGHMDVPLNETGIEQTKKAAEQLKDKKIDLIISSDLSRARMTAEIIKKATGAELIIDERFRERRYGVAQGLPIEEVKEKYGAQVYSYDTKILGGESFRELEQRVWEAFSNHKKNHHHKNIVIVTHGGVIRAIRKKLKNLDFNETIGIPGTANALPIKLDLSEKCKNCGVDFYEQDPDVFDTWFSSGQWPFAALMSGKKRKEERGKRKITSDFKTFYPTDVMAPGYEILFFWVARMIMLGIYRAGKIPFRTVYLHGIVRDKDRQKMSKSKGNVIDPLAVTKIYGADAVRMALLAGTAPGNDPVVSEDKIRGYRNFATKIWNISRFVLMHKPSRNHAKADRTRETARNDRPIYSRTDKKHLGELKILKTDITEHLEKFEFHLAAEKLYRYIWHEFADKIIESYKSRLQNDDGAGRAAACQTLETILRECLKMLHPFMPFITEEIYQKIEPGRLLMVEKW